jgi:hypothetical protein
MCGFLLDCGLISRFLMDPVLCALETCAGTLRVSRRSLHKA